MVQATSVASIDALAAALLGGSNGDEPLRYEPGEGFLTAWLARCADLEGAASDPSSAALDAALRAGALADRLGVAFAGGYRGALRTLAPTVVGPRDRAALCVTERRSTRPRDLRARLERDPRTGALALHGEKSFVTFGALASTLLVAARDVREAGEGALAALDDPSARPALALLAVPAATAGVLVTPHAPSPVAPEVPHAAVRFDAVRVEPAWVLEGDGYDRYVKPFRTVEDVFVLAAACGYLLGVARRAGLAAGPREALFALACALRSVAREDPTSPGAHLALAGCLAQLRAWLDAQREHLWPRVAADERARWERDAALLHVAERAREARRERAYERLAGLTA